MNGQAQGEPTRALVAAPPSSAVTMAPRPLEFTPAQREMIRNSFASGASEQEFAVLMEVARARNLNPMLGQIHFVKRWTQERGEVWSHQVSIDGFRAIAERTGKYDGQDEPEFEYGEDTSVPRLARVRVYRKDWNRPAVGVAHFSEYAQFRKSGELTRMWATKPHVMLAKCSEALAFRKAFPEDTSGLYAPEEMQADDESRRESPSAAPAGANAVETFAKKITSARTLQALQEIGEEIAKCVPKRSRGPLEKAFRVRLAELRARAEEDQSLDVEGDEEPSVEREPGEDDQ